MESDGHGAQAHVDAIHDGKRGVDAGQLLDDDRFGDVVNGRTAVRFGNGDAVQTVFKEGLPLFRGRHLMLVSVLYGGCQNGFSKVPHQFSNHLLFIGFAKVHALPDGPSERSFLTRWLASKNTFFLSLHIPPVEAASSREPYG